MGYDVTRFLQPPGDSLSCPVCRDVLCDPVTICPDGDVVCSSCSPTSKSCPVDACSASVHPPSSREANVTLRTKVIRLLVRCAGASLGCSWKGPLKDERAHAKKCAFQLSPCPHEGCNQKVALSSLEMHRVECPMRVVPCPNAPGCTFKEALAKHESHRLICNRYRCRQQSHGCRFIGTLAALREHRDFCNATWDELLHLRAQANIAPQISRHLVNANALAPHAPALPSRRQATLPPTPTSSLAKHRKGDDGSESSLISASEASPDVTISKLAPTQNHRRALASTGRDRGMPVSSGPPEEQSAVQTRVIKHPAEALSRSSSVSLESLLAEHEGGGERAEQPHLQVEAVAGEDLQLSVSPWIDSPSPVGRRPAEKHKSLQLEGGDHEKWATRGSNGPPKKRQRIETERVTDNGEPEDQSKRAAGFTAAGTQHPPSNHTPSHPNTKRIYSGNYRGGRGRGGFGQRTQDRKYQNSYGPNHHPAPGPQLGPEIPK